MVLVDHQFNRMLPNLPLYHNCATFIYICSFEFHFTDSNVDPKSEMDSDSNDADAQSETGLEMPPNDSNEEKPNDDGMLGNSSKANSISGEAGEALTAMDPAIAMGADFVPLEKDSAIIGECLLVYPFFVCHFR